MNPYLDLQLPEVKYQLSIRHDWITEVTAQLEILTKKMAPPGLLTLSFKINGIREMNQHLLSRRHDDFHNYSQRIFTTFVSSS